MKQWEVMRLLEENPAKVYEAKMKCDYTARMGVNGGYYWFEIFDGEALIGQYRGDGAFNGNAGLYLDWHEAKQSVTWQEAIQEFAKGKKLIVKLNNQEWTLGALVELTNYLDIAITKGKWYVED